MKRFLKIDWVAVLAVEQIRVGTNEGRIRINEGRNGTIEGITRLNEGRSGTNDQF